MADRSTIQLPGRPLAVRASSGRTPLPAPAGSPAPQAVPEALLREIQAEREQLGLAWGAIQDGLTQLNQLREALVKEAEQQLVDLALDIARKVLMQEIQAGRYEIEPIVRQSLQQVPSRQDVVAHLHPEDWSRCQMAQAPADPRGASGNVRFVADPSVPRAHCVLETPEGIIHSDVQEHLERIGEALRSPE